MKFSLKDYRQHTLIPPELIEIYQPVLGYEAVSVWINLFHALANGQYVTEQELLQQMNIPQRTFRSSLGELKKYSLIQQLGKEDLVVLQPLTVEGILNLIKIGDYSPEQQRRFLTLSESFLLRRGQAYQEEEVGEPTPSQEQHQLSEQQADEFATRFIKECSFIPNRQLRERFDLWFEQITDSRLLEELLERTKRKVQNEGNKGTCPSLYADKIVQQWLVQGIKTYDDLMRRDQEFHAQWEFYRIVEKELGRSFNSLTPAEKEIINKWSASVSDVNEMSKIIKQAILSGEYQGKGAPSIAFIDKWFNTKDGKSAKPTAKSKAAFTHQHSVTDLQKVIRRKTMVGLGDDGNEG